MVSNSRTFTNYSEAYFNACTEQHGGAPIPERLPTEIVMEEMLELTRHNLELMQHFRDYVRRTFMEKAREGKRTVYDDDDGSVYGDATKSQYPPGEVKKRRGVSQAPLSMIQERFYANMN
jgi:hypothetical protein